MSSERWRQIEDLYQAARAQEPTRRGRFLEEHCHGDAGLRAEVESLLAREAGAERLLGSTAWLPAPSLPTQDSHTLQARLTEGTQLGPYRIVEWLGAGGMGTVYRAQDTRLGRMIALKLLPPDRLHDPERRLRFLQEARTVSELNHPHIVALYDLGCVDGQDFLVLEYVKGRSLDQLIPKHGMPLRQVLTYAIQIADALRTAHAAGVVHRDLKPANVMLTEKGGVKLLDFGLAKLIEANTNTKSDEETRLDVPHTASGLIVGTLSYMSPEQAEGKPVDTRSDLFSFGSVLYEMLTGQQAFSGQSAASIVSAILRDEPKPVSLLRSEVPGELERILQRCLRKDPDRRFQHADDLRVALLEVQEEIGTQAVKPSALVRPRARFWWAPITAAAAARL